MALLPELPALLSRYLKGTYGVGATPVPGAPAALSAEAAAIGIAVAKFNGALAALLSKHGKDIIHEQYQLQRVANIAIDLYGCLAVTSRMTSAEKDKVPHLAHEYTLAKAFIQGALGRIAVNEREILAGGGRNGDALLDTIAAETLAAGHYLPTHPLRL